MPQIIFRFDLNLFSGQNNIKTVRTIGEQIRPMLAEAMSTEEHPLSENDIDWVPQPYCNGYMAAGIIAIEIRTYGFPDRKKKFNEAAARTLKEKIFALPLLDRKAIKKNDPLIWVQYLDIEGPHV